MFRHLMRPVVRHSQKGVRSYKVAQIEPPNMNELPVPQGSWQEHYNKMQAKYHMQLGIAVITFIGTIIAAKSTGLIYLNYAPPTPKAK